ncbi:MAG: hypothetical protein Q9219_003499 [cf. Caloplaca sp. 3 TL-2023]
MKYAEAHHLNISRQPRNVKLVEFADGTIEKTVGQVSTSWIFDSGLHVPITFEILQKCCCDVILGELFIYDYNVFEDHASSMTTYDLPSYDRQLAPFGFVKLWQRGLSSLGDAIKMKPHASSPTNLEAEKKEIARREAWNYRFRFGDAASEVEKAAEDQRRREYGATQTQLPELPALTHQRQKLRERTLRRCPMT